MDWYTFEKNRSERAKQTELLAPVLRSHEGMYSLLKGLSNFSLEEAKLAKVMHFVWVLRDTFTFERDCSINNRKWSQLASRWVYILGLPEWANDLNYWRHPNGYKGDPDYVVHPTQRGLGWTQVGLNGRYATIFPIQSKETVKEELFEARKVMNTECDCFIQTPKRLIVIECKDKTSFRKEQRSRQKRLFACLQRLLNRPCPLLYIELSNAHCDSSFENSITWEEVRLCASVNKNIMVDPGRTSRTA